MSRDVVVESEVSAVELMVVSVQEQKQGQKPGLKQC